MAKKDSYRVLRVIACILANATGILAANYITFYILDHFNPGMHFVMYSTFPLTQYLHWIIAALAVLSGMLYLLLFNVDAFKRHKFNLKRLILILVLDILLAGAFAMTVNTHAFDWLHLRDIQKENLVAVATLTPTPEPTAAPTAEPTAAPELTPAPDGSTPVPTEEPTATRTSLRTERL